MPIEFDDVSVTYRGGVKALRNVDLTIDDGEFVVVVGLSGAGKSTLLRCLNGLVPATSGSIRIDGVEVVGAKGAKLRGVRKNIGMIFQTFNLATRTTVLNNVLMGRLAYVPTWRSTFGLWPADDKEIAFQALERVGIVDKAYVRASNLSGGQQQRVGIARALAQEPTVMLADEPVAALDPVTSHQVMGDLQRINRELGITTLINLHFLDLARNYGKRLIGLRDGELVFDGDIADVDDDTFHEIYGRAITPDDLLAERGEAAGVVTDAAVDAVASATARPIKPRLRLRSVLIVLGVVAFTFYAARQAGWDWGSFVSVWTNPLWARFWPIDWDWVLDRRNVIDPLLETFQIAIVATVIGCSLAMPIGFMMSQLTTPNRPTFIVARSVMNVLRVIPDLLLAVILVAAVSIGAFGGTIALTIFSLAVLVKLFSETVDAADPRPLEAALAAGGRHTAAVRAGVLPEVFPAYVAYSAYVFELNVRASVVIGLVGGGGIGRVIEAQRQFFRYDRIFGVLIILFAIVAVIEQISDAIRRRVL